MRIRGTILQTPVRGDLQVLDDHVIDVDPDGTIDSVVPAAAALTAGSDAAVDVVVPVGSVLLPGLIDTHVHAPQWPQLGTGLDLPLDAWLMQYTFPLEARCADLAHARSVWDDLVPGLLAEGTTTAVYFATIHEEATVALAEACVRHGQRAFVGRVAMDHPVGTADWYRDANAVAAVDASRRSIEAITGLAGTGDRVQPIITPRFIPACTDELLTGLGALAAETGVRVQSHVSESDWEHGHVLDRHSCTDSESLDRFGLVRDHTVLAHGGHLTGDDVSLLVGRGAGVAHCPLSNTYFGNAVFPARRHLDAGLRVGLGTDIAGGPDPSLLRQCGHAVSSSRMLEDGVDPDLEAADRGVDGSRIDILTAFWMATTGGADLLGVPCGVLEPGRRFDAIMIDAPGVGGEWEQRFEKLLRSAHRSAIKRVWVDGIELLTQR